MNVNDNIDGAPTNHHPQQYKIDPAMKIGHVSLNVSNLSRSLDFYESVLGLRESADPQEVKHCYPLATITPHIFWNCCK
jgi:catechol-2,3-dioxygenase